MALSEDLSRIAEAAVTFAAPGEELAGIVPAEPGAAARVYLCAFRGEGDRTTWLALDDDARPVESRVLLRDAVSIVAMCELAEEATAGGDLDELLSRLVALRLTENPPGIDQAEEAVRALQATIGAAPIVASPARLDAVGGATRRLEQALGESSASPFAEAMKQAVGTIESLASDVEANYKLELQ